MRILIVSDLHANPDALAVLPEADATLCAGDLVDFGPDPAAALAWCREREATVVMGNHDFALSTGADCGVKGTMRAASVQTRAVHRRLLEREDVDDLRALPRVAVRSIAGTTFALTHAVPDDVYRYSTLAAAGSLLHERIPEADVLVLGHTHVQGCIRQSGRVMVNPGSVGVATLGGTAHFALWEDGEVSLHGTTYDVEAAIAKVRGLELGRDALDAVVDALRNGRSRSAEDFATRR